ncbi:unnamed protein product [Pedinophyceae sp. YPF-701]|nr:unnamed protein product [Pedinophyceae sp. YPF-701]CAG9462119.1 unnamed protein product [Pedinophyceae sp. YPF-701]
MPGVTRWLQAVGWSIVVGWTAGFYMERFKIHREPKPPPPYGWDTMSAKEKGKAHHELFKQRTSRMFTAGTVSAARWSLLAATLFGVESAAKVARAVDDPWNQALGGAATGVAAAGIMPTLSPAGKLRALAVLPAALGATGLAGGYLYHWVEGIKPAESEGESAQG